MDILKTSLNLNKLPGEDPGSAISNLIISAVQEDKPSCTLTQIHQAILRSSVYEDLDPLAVIPTLYSCPKEGAEDLLDVIGKRCNPKEVVMAVLEVSERLEKSLRFRYDGDVEDEVEEDEGSLTSTKQTIRLLKLYTDAFPRYPKRKRLPSETLRLVVPDLESIIKLVGRICSPQEGRDLIIAVTAFGSSIAAWALQYPDDVATSRDIVFGLISCTLEACANCIQAGLADQAFRKYFPRLVMRSSTAAGSGSGRVPDVVQGVLNLLSDMFYMKDDFQMGPSISSLILHAHSSSYTMNINTLAMFLPILIASIQSNTALDETLSLLFESFGALNISPRPELPSDLLIPLIHILGPLSSVHPDAPTRHTTFRILALVLSFAPSPVRLRLLRDMLSDSETSPPQLQVAAIGLVKEATLEALSLPEPHTGEQPNAFTSSLFMRELGSVIFCQSHGLDLTLEDFLESPEPLRLIESLGLYYLLVQRDVDNRTGIRDPDFSKEMESALIVPLVSQLRSWGEEPKEPNAQGHEDMQLGILGMWLERAHSALRDVIGNSAE